MINIKSEKGITLVTLVITVVLLVLVTTILATNSYTSMNLSRLTKLNNDIQALDDRVSAYFVENDKLPIIESEKYEYPAGFGKGISDRGAYDGPDYYTIDLALLDNLSLNYGEDTATSGTDKYVINEKSHTIYYLAGIEYNGTVYHTTVSEKLF